jgi:hypothetical protein
MRRGQGADAPSIKTKKEIETPDGDIVLKTVNEPIGFDCVLKLEKSKSSLSEKENTEIHLPFLFKEGFPVKKDDVETGVVEEEKEEVIEETTDEVPETPVKKKRGRKPKVSEE